MQTELCKHAYMKILLASTLKRESTDPTTAWFYNSEERAVIVVVIVVVVVLIMVVFVTNYLLPTYMVSVNHAGLCPPREGCTIYFYF
jgi:uncharacterized membrane protein required for colicin V production